MFKRNPAPTFKVAVLITVAGEDKPLDLQITFRHKNKAALEAWMASGQDDASLLDEVIETWHDVQDDAGRQVPYGKAELQGLLNDYPASHGEIFRSYLRELTASKAKNS